MGGGIPNVKFLASSVCWLSLSNQKIEFMDGHNIVTLLILDKMTCTKVPYISKVNYRKSFRDYKLSGICVSPTSQVYVPTVVILFYKIKRVWNRGSFLWRDMHVCYYIFEPTNAYIFIKITII